MRYQTLVNWRRKIVFKIYFIRKYLKLNTTDRMLLHLCNKTKFFRYNPCINFPSGISNSPLVISELALSSYFLESNVKTNIQFQILKRIILSQLTIKWVLSGLRVSGCICVVIKVIKIHHKFFNIRIQFQPKITALFYFRFSAKKD